MLKQSRLFSRMRAVMLIGITMSGIVACGSDTAPATPVDPPTKQAPTPQSLAVAPMVAVMDIGVSEPLSVTVFDAAQDTITGYAVTWRSGDPSVASVNSDGVVTATGSGLTTAYVTVAGITDSIGIAVTPPPPAGSRFVKVAVKTDHACAISDGGGTYCWGSNSGGWISPASTQARYTTPTRIVGAPAFADLVPGASFTCGVTTSGDLYCWGTIPTDTTGSRSMRTVVTGMSFTQVAAGSAHICGLTQSGDVYCWGKNTSGQLGTGDIIDTKLPTKIAGTFKFTSLTADQDATCGIATDSTAVCWGNAAMTGASMHTPTSMGNIRFTTLSAGQSGSGVCGTTSSGTSYCWGAAFLFPLGTVAAVNGAVGSIGAAPTFTTLQPGGAFVCGLSNRFAYCWGSGTRGETGAGVIEDPRSAIVAPYQVLEGIQYAQISVGAQSTCGITVTGRLYCWGANSFGQLGDGDTTDAAEPVGNRTAGG